MEITELEFLDPDRVDAVGTPANGTPFLMLKASDPSAAARRHMADEGVAMPDGSYPIPDLDHLKAAIHAVGRGNASHDAIRRHVIKRAKALGHADLIPDNWNSDGSLSKETSMDDATKAAPGQISAQDEAHTPDPSVAARQTEENHPENGPREGDNAQEGGLEMPGMSGSPAPEANGEGYGTTADDKSVPMGEAQSQTSEVHKAGEQDGRGDVAGAEGDEDLKAAEAEQGKKSKDDFIEYTNPDVEKGSTATDADTKPGSPAWEEKDVALAEKAEQLLNEALDVVRQFGQREKDEASKAGRRLSSVSEQAIRRAIKALEDLLAGSPSTDSATKEIESMTADELIKLLDERDARRAKAEEKAAKKAAKAADPKHVAKQARKAAEKAAHEVAKSVGVDADALVEAFKAAVKPLEERVAVVEAQPGTPAMLNGAGLAGTPVAVATRGQEGDAAVKAVRDLEAQLAAETDPVRKSQLSKELTHAKLVNFERMRSTGFAGA